MSVRGSDEKFAANLKALTDGDAVADATTWYRLQAWKRRQRHLFHAGALAADRAAALEASGFDWGSGPRPNSSRQLLDAKADDAAFDAALAAFDAHVAATGAPPPSRSAAPVFVGDQRVWTLGAWVRATRAAYAKGALPGDRVAKLKASRFDFDPKETLWTNFYEALVAFKADHGHCAVPRYARGHALHALGEWGERQRRGRRTGALRPDRRTKLDAVAFEWDVPARHAAWAASKKYHPQAASSAKAAAILRQNTALPSAVHTRKAAHACKCGSTTHSRVTSLECPLNPRNRIAQRQQRQPPPLPTEGARAA